MFANIVVGTDGSDSAGKAVEVAAELAAAMGSTMHVVTAYASGMTDLADLEVDYEPGDAAANVLAAASQSLADKGIEVETHVGKSDPADALIDIAGQVGADLIVVGSKGMTGAKRFLLGSVPNNVSHHAPCSVLIVRTAE